MESGLFVEKLAQGPLVSGRLVFLLLPQRRPGGSTRSSGSGSAPRARERARKHGQRGRISSESFRAERCASEGGGTVSVLRNLAIDGRRPGSLLRSTAAGTSATSAAAPTRRCRHHRSPDRTSSIDRPKSANNNFTKKKLPQRRPGGPTRSSGSLSAPRARGIGDNMVHSGRPSRRDRAPAKRVDPVAAKGSTARAPAIAPNRLSLKGTNPRPATVEQRRRRRRARFGGHHPPRDKDQQISSRKSRSERTTQSPPVGAIARKKTPPLGAASRARVRCER